MKEGTPSRGAGEPAARASAPKAETRPGPAPASVGNQALLHHARAGGSLAGVGGAPVDNLTLAHVTQFRDGMIPPGVVARWPWFKPDKDPADASADPDREGDAKDETSAADAELPAEPIELVFSDDADAALGQAVNQVLVREDATYAQIAQRLYGDPTHTGAFTREGRSITFVSLESVVPDVAKRMRGLIDAENASDVDWLVDKVSERRIDGDDERAMMSRITWWANRAELRDEAGTSYFAILIDRLDHRKLSEWGLFSDTTRSATDWIIIEVEEQEDTLISLLAMRGVRAPTHPRSDDAEPSGKPAAGPVQVGEAVGQYTFTRAAPKLALYSTDYLGGYIRVTRPLPVEEPTAERAVAELQNTTEIGPRVMIPGRDGKFYGYAVDFHFFANDYQPGSERHGAQTLTGYWWSFPGTVFIKGGEYHPEYAEGDADERKHRREIFDRAFAPGTLEPLLGLDFDVLAVATLDQRVVIIERALAGRDLANASLIARLLYATPPSDFPELERRLSSSDLMSQLLRKNWPDGVLAMIGRIFTIRAVQSVQLPGETLKDLPELQYGYDEDGYYHHAQWKMSRTPSGESAAITFQPGKFHGGGIPELLIRKLTGSIEQ
ncbi:MAG TPA: hypothetical protein VGL17_05700, partial [Gemmatimonadaceae bacterium]